MKELSDEDRLVVELLGLLDEYTQLQVANRQRWIDGYVNLSRANYAHHTKQYGMDRYDLRDHQAQFTVKKPVELNDESNETNTETSKETDQVSEVRNRHASEKKATTTQTNDALRQFGVLVPKELRQAQSRFQDAVEVSVDIARLGQRIHQIVDQLMPLHEAIIAKQKQEKEAKQDESDEIEKAETTTNEAEDIESPSSPLNTEEPKRTTKCKPKNEAIATDKPESKSIETKQTISESKLEESTTSKPTTEVDSKLQNLNLSESLPQSMDSNPTTPSSS
ncbi:hypothetical protein DIURU_005175 [Diutina rugosa]|uniref:Vacuolar ATPase assembly protein VMA22 n=1 Tax=Diutina rugosa TaxID=5481 RepID=A0A642UEI8_DIURU|nr:uncharacterized protein DIURU_005175 [Diutina rugosa]KAA8897576.1 hypothetical protein DIURU_005175 [Diutina rugosa]